MELLEVGIAKEKEAEAQLEARHDLFEVFLVSLSEQLKCSVV